MIHLKRLDKIFKQELYHGRNTKNIHPLYYINPNIARSMVMISFTVFLIPSILRNDEIQLRFQAFGSSHVNKPRAVV